MHPSLQARAVTAFIHRFMRADDDPASLGDPADGWADLRRRFLTDQRREPRLVPDDFVPAPALSGDGVRVLERRAPGTPPFTLVHLPGGAYTKPADPAQFRFLHKLGDATGARIVAALYALAPEHTWRDSRAALVELVSRLAAQGPVVLSGDSAGGGLALAVAQAVRDAGRPGASRMVLISPWADLRRDVPGRDEAAATDPWLTLPLLHVYASWWAGSEEERSRPEVSPALGDLAGLPPTLAFCGTHDLLLPENLALADRARAAGWDYELLLGEAMIHVYPILPIPEADAARRRIVAFLG